MSCQSEEPHHSNQDDSVLDLNRNAETGDFMWDQPPEWRAKDESDSLERQVRYSGRMSELSRLHYAARVPACDNVSAVARRCHRESRRTEFFASESKYLLAIEA